MGRTEFESANKLEQAPLSFRPTIDTNADSKDKSWQPMVTVSELAGNSASMEMIPWLMAQDKAVIEQIPWYRTQNSGKLSR